MIDQARQSGYVALLAVLIVGAVSVASSLALLVTGTDAQRSTLIRQQSAQARTIAEACVEEALQQVHDNTAFVGTNSLSFSLGSCSYIVTNIGGSNRLISATGSVGNAVKKTQVYVTITASNISVTSWQEVGD